MFVEHMQPGRIGRPSLSFWGQKTPTMKLSTLCGTLSWYFEHIGLGFEGSRSRDLVIQMSVKVEPPSTRSIFA